MRRLALAGIGLLLTGMTSQAGAAGLAVSVDGVRNAEGRVMVAVYRGKDGFRDQKKAVALINLRARKGSVTVTLPDLPVGAYAVAVFHDENGDEKLATNLLGIPTEGYGFSNDARGNMGPPSFADSAIQLNDGIAAVPIKMAY